MSGNISFRERSGKAADSPQSPRLSPRHSPSTSPKGSYLHRYAVFKRHFLCSVYGRALLMLATCAVVFLTWTCILSTSGDWTRDDAAGALKTLLSMGGFQYNDEKTQYSIQINTSAGMLSPNTSVLYPPYQDLCEWVSGTHTLSMVPSAAMPEAVLTPDADARAQVESAMDRFEHIPAEGGAAGERWSTATGLPVASTRSGEVKVRFVTITNRTDATTHFTTVASALAGVRLEVVGLGWKHFSLIKRLGLLASYAEREGLTDADVLVAMDGDVVLSGEDAEGFFEAFVASTAESEAEHMTYSLRDIRTGKRQTPVLFSADRTCSMPQAYSTGQCRRAYKKVYDMREDWIVSTNANLQRNFNRYASKYLNGGVMVSRVWALRRLNTTLDAFTQHAKPKAQGPDWWCDQTALAALYLDLLRWELDSHAWDGKPQKVSKRAQRAMIYSPPHAPSNGFGPYNMPPGFIGIDQSTVLSAILDTDMTNKMLNGVSDKLQALLHEPKSKTTVNLKNELSAEMSETGVVRSSHRLTISPRRHVDCVGVKAQPPPECAYRDAVWGIPEDAGAVTPLLWHFAGDQKRERFAQSRTVFPWYTPTLINSEALQHLVHVFANLPPTRVFLIDPKTNIAAFNETVGVLLHNTTDDVTVAEMCRTTVLKSKK